MESDVKPQKSMQAALGQKEPYLFFGPCSAESLSQLRNTAEGLQKNFSQIIFRAGLWKPRTRPNSFEGVGAQGLPWLQSIKKEFGFKVTTEVASAQHVEQCLKHEIDVLWIGARTTVNPFLVQEIAEALRGCNVPVFVKNPIHPDLSLWLGGIERLQQQNTGPIGAIHRGFHLVNNGAYRNHPQWDMAIKLKAEHPDLPLITDASHISGKPELIPYVAQKAFDLDMDGLMIETHCRPQEALSDVQQQITPANLFLLHRSLTRKAESSANPEYKNNLEKLRDEIDQIDDHLLEELAKRMQIAKQIGEYKKNNKVTVLQVSRWQKILQERQEYGEALGLSSSFIEDLLHSIHKESIKQQTAPFEDD